MWVFRHPSVRQEGRRLAAIIVAELAGIHLPPPLHTAMLEELHRFARDVANKRAAQALPHASETQRDVALARGVASAASSSSGAGPLVNPEAAGRLSASAKRNARKKENQRRLRQEGAGW